LAGAADGASDARTDLSPLSRAVVTSVFSAAWRMSLSSLSRSFSRICGGVMQLRARPALDMFTSQVKSTTLILLFVPD
jgi:hypothetical protein